MIKKISPFFKTIREMRKNVLSQLKNLTILFQHNFDTLETGKFEAKDNSFNFALESIQFNEIEKEISKELEKAKKSSVDYFDAFMNKINKSLEGENLSYIYKEKKPSKKFDLKVPDFKPDLKPLTTDKKPKKLSINVPKLPIKTSQPENEISVEKVDKKSPFKVESPIKQEKNSEIGKFDNKKDEFLKVDEQKEETEKTELKVDNLIKNEEKSSKKDENLIKETVIKPEKVPEEPEKTEEIVKADSEEDIFKSISKEIASGQSFSNEYLKETKPIDKQLENVKKPEEIPTEKENILTEKTALKGNESTNDKIQKETVKKEEETPKDFIFDTTGDLNKVKDFMNAFNPTALQNESKKDEIDDLFSDVSYSDEKVEEKEVKNVMEKAVEGEIEYLDNFWVKEGEWERLRLFDSKLDEKKLDGFEIVMRGQVEIAYNENLKLLKEQMENLKSDMKILKKDQNFGKMFDFFDQCNREGNGKVFFKTLVKEIDNSEFTLFIETLMFKLINSKSKSLLEAKKGVEMIVRSTRNIGENFVFILQISSPLWIPIFESQKIGSEKKQMEVFLKQLFFIEVILKRDEKCVIQFLWKWLAMCSNSNKLNKFFLSLAFKTAKHFRKHLKHKYGENYRKLMRYFVKRSKDIKENALKRDFEALADFI